MDSCIKIDKNKVVIDLTKLKDASINEMVLSLKEIVYNNNVDVFSVIAGTRNNDTDEFYFFKNAIEALKSHFNIFLMLKTKYFPNTKFFDSVFALGVDALNLSMQAEDIKSDQFSDTVKYATNLWPSGAIFTDIVADDCSSDEIKEAITLFSKIKIVPRIVKEKGCEASCDELCLRDFVIDSLKKNGVNLKWVVNFELCSVIQQTGEKGRSKRKIAGKFALELAALRRKLMIKEVQNSFDSASL